MHRVVDPVSQRVGRRILATTSAVIGAAAVAVSQWHVLPPMLCFAVLVAGLLLLGVAALALVERYLLGASRLAPGRSAVQARRRCLRGAGVSAHATVGSEGAALAPLPKAQ